MSDWGEPTDDDKNKALKWMRLIEMRHGAWEFLSEEQKGMVKARIEWALASEQ